MVAVALTRPVDAVSARAVAANGGNTTGKRAHRAERRLNDSARNGWTATHCKGRLESVTAQRSAAPRRRE